MLSSLAVFAVVPAPAAAAATAQEAADGTHVHHHLSREMGVEAVHLHSEYGFGQDM